MMERIARNTVRKVLIRLRRPGFVVRSKTGYFAR